MSILMTSRILSRGLPFMAAAMPQASAFRIWVRIRESEMRLVSSTRTLNCSFLSLYLTANCYTALMYCRKVGRLPSSSIFLYAYRYF